MKKLFLLALLVAMAGVAQAQQVTMRAPQQMGPGVVSDNSAEGPSVIKGVPRPQRSRHHLARDTQAEHPSQNHGSEHMVEIGKMAKYLRRDRREPQPDRL
jgi:hypothetical protein